MVTKNPCSHPGDIRLLKAVGETDSRFEVLRDYINVIVFPKKGYRPEQHKMSGGDLDGDCFMVMWDQLVIDTLKPDLIKPPAVYLKYEDDSKIKSDKIEDHIKRYFEKDNLGHIANVHLALCDQLGPEGPYTDDCVELSRLQAVAVDFAKHGKCVSKESYEHIESKLR
jgi:RNA-dependent RNA polymerase